MDPRTRNLALLAGVLVLVPAGVWLLRSPERTRPRGGGSESPREPAAEQPGMVGAREAVRSATPAERATARPSGPAPSAHDEPAPAPEVRVLRVEGRVHDLEDKPIEGAELVVQEHGSEPDLRVVARSDADGLFRGELAGTQRGLTFLALAARFQGEQREVSRPGTGLLQLGTFRLAPGGEVAGRVLDEAGRPLRGAFVIACPPSAFPEDEGHARESGVEFDPEDQEGFQSVDSSDPDGRYRLRGLPVGECFVVGWREDRAFGWTEILEVRRDGALERDIVLPPSRSAFSQITGIVRDPGGKPQAAIRVEAGTGGSGLELLGFDRWDLSSADGTFVLEGDWSGPVVVRATDPKERWAPAERPGVLPGTRDLELVLGEPSWLTVRLQDADGRPIAWGHVRHAETWTMHDTGRDGQVRFQEPSRPFTLEGSAPGYRTEKFGPFEPDAVGDELVLTLQPGQALRGRVLFGGRPVAGAKVDLCGMREPGTTLEARDVAPPDNPFLLTGFVDLAASDGTSDAAGNFLLTLHQDGWQSLRVEAKGFPMQVFGPFQLSKEAGLSGLEVELERAGAVEGRVLLRPGEDPAQQLVGACNGWSFVRVAPVAADGTYRIEDLAPGDYQLRSCRPPVAALQELVAAGSKVDGPVSWDCRVAAGATTRFDLDLTGEGSVVLAGQLSLDGNEESGWRASLVSPAAPGGLDPRRSPRAEAEVDAEGRFQLVLSRPGRYRLVLEAPMLRLEQEVELFSGPNEWSYRRETANVRVHSTDATEKERRDWSWLRLVTADGSSAHFACSIALVQLRDCGDWRFRFPAGPARLERSENGYLPGTEWTLVRELTVVAGEELVLDYP